MNKSTQGRAPEAPANQTAKSEAAPEPAAGEKNPGPAEIFKPLPTVGRVVQYWPPEIQEKYPAPRVALPTADKTKKQPYAAIVTHVNDDGTVNLGVINDAEFPLRSTTLGHVHRRKEPGLAGWDWPPRS